MSADLLDEQLRANRAFFGSHVTLVGEAIRLTLGNGISAVLVAHPLVRWLDMRLTEWSCPSPILLLPGPRRRCVFFAESDGSLVDGNRDRSVVVAGNHESIPLPPSAVGDDHVRWIRQPDPGRRWLPTLTSVMCAVESLKLRSDSAA
jgi:hypothetical protein